MKDKEVRKMWLDRGTWNFLFERLLETQDGFDVVAGPSDY